MPTFAKFKDGLSPKQAKFVQEYLIDINSTEAARRAGYSHPNQNGPRTLRLPKVRAAVEAALEERRKSRAVTADRVVDRLAQIAFAEVDLTRSSALTSQVRSLELLGKHLGLFVERTEISGPNGGPVEIDKQTAAARIVALLEMAKKRKGDD